MIVSCVLRESAAFDRTKVEWLASMVRAHLPQWQFLPFSDVSLSMPHRRLQSDLPSWWAKMEIHASDLPGPVLILDLDTVIVRKWITTVEQLSRPYILRHFTRDGFRYPEQFCGGMLLTTPAFRSRVADHFRPSHIVECHGDDQTYYYEHHRSVLSRFQDEWPDEMVSYKLHVLDHGLRPDNTFINFHGLPRPWDISHDWIPKCSPPAEPSQADV